MLTLVNKEKLEELRNKARQQGYNSTIEHVHTESSILKVMQCIYLTKLQIKRKGYEPF